MPHSLIGYAGSTVRAAEMFRDTFPDEPMVVGTGSFIPDSWAETYATADIVAYGDVPMVKVGREFLLRKNGARRQGGA